MIALYIYLCIPIFCIGKCTLTSVIPYTSSNVLPFDTLEEDLFQRGKKTFYSVPVLIKLIILLLTKIIFYKEITNFEIYRK